MANGSRYFATIIYPESCNIDITRSVGPLLKWLNENSLNGCISPLHDPDNADLSSEESLEKSLVDSQPEQALISRKPHYHLLLYFKGNRTLQSVVGLIKQPLNSGPVIALSSGSGYCRYMLHLDFSPSEKQRWPDGTRLSNFGCFDSDKFITSIEDTQRAIFELIEKYEISSIANLFSFMYSQNFSPHYFAFVRNNVYLVKSLCDEWRVFFK